MLAQLQYSVSGHWTAGGQSFVAGEGIGKAIEFTAPPEFHGESGFWTPEHFLLAAVASCFIATFRAMARLSQLDPLALDMAVEGKLDKSQGGYEFTHIMLRPVLTVRDDHERVLAYRLLEKAEHGCLIARSLKCQVTMEVTIKSPRNVDVDESAPVSAR